MQRRSAMLTAAVVIVAVVLAAPVATAAEPPPADYIVVLKDSVADPAAVSARQARRYQARRTAVFTHAIKGYATQLTSSQAAAALADPTVQFVTRDRSIRLPAPTPAPPRCEDVLGGRQCLPDWADRIEVDRASTRAGDGHGSVNINVAIIDTGIAGDHPDLNVKGGADCQTGTVVVPGTSLTDTYPHGTAVAGVVGAKDNQIGVVGTAPGTPLWSARVADPEGGITLSAVLCAIDWVTSTRSDTSPSNDIAVANMSLAFPGADDGRCGLANQDVLHLAICRSVAAGVSYVAGAGNAAVDLAGAVPAAYDEVLAATGIADLDGQPGGKAAPDCYGLDLGPYGVADDTPAPFSNYAGTRRDLLHTIAAPAVCVETSFPPELPDAYFFADGTSLAAPAVAGTIALCITDGKCRAGHPARNLLTVQADTASYNLSHRGYGYEGDPFRPLPGRSYGFLVTAAPY
jgi:subtilisin family serine protease